jgi:hypothetical protein
MTSAFAGHFFGAPERSTCSSTRRAAGATGGRSTKEAHMMWVLIIGAAWLGVGVAVALLLGRGILLADRQAAKRRVPRNGIAGAAPPKAFTQSEGSRRSVPSARTSAVRTPVLSSGPTQATRDPGPA